MSNSFDEYMSDSYECLLAKLRSAPRRAPRTPQQSVAHQNTASRVSDSVADCGDSSDDRFLETLLIKQQHKASNAPPAASRAPSTASHAPQQTARHEHTLLGAPRDASLPSAADERRREALRRLKNCEHSRRYWTRIRANPQLHDKVLMK